MALSDMAGSVLASFGEAIAINGTPARGLVSQDSVVDEGTGQTQVSKNLRLSVPLGTDLAVKDIVTIRNIEWEVRTSVTNPTLITATLRRKTK